MFNWLKQILAGNHNPDFPKNATVERDPQGRVSEVSVTLGDDTKIEENPSPVPSAEFQKELDIGLEALVARNCELIQMGFGLEQTYEFSQDDRVLTLLFADGRKILAEGEIIGSFDPSAKSFMWAWANPSVPTDENSPSVQLRQLGLAKNEPVLLDPKQSLKFEKIVELMAFARQHAQLDGVYRAFTNGHVSAFIGYRLKSFIDANGNDVPAEEFAAPVRSEQVSKAQTLCDAYDAEMLVVDTDFNSQDARDNMGPFLDRKAEIYARYWQRDDDYWEPCSFGWPSEYDSKNYPIKFTGPSSNQTVLIGRMSGFRKTIYLVEFFDEEPKITDQLIDWGDGFIWPI